MNKEIGLKSGEKMNSKTRKSELWREFDRVILDVQACENEWNRVCIYWRSEWDQEDEEKTLKFKTLH